MTISNLCSNITSSFVMSTVTKFTPLSTAVALGTVNGLVKSGLESLYTCYTGQQQASVPTRIVIETLSIFASAAIVTLGTGALGMTLPFTASLSFGFLAFTCRKAANVVLYILFNREAYLDSWGPFRKLIESGIETSGGKISDITSYRNFFDAIF